MSQAAKQHHLRMDHTLSRVIPIEEAFTQAQLQEIEAQLNLQLHLELNRRGHLVVRYDATLLKFSQVLIQLAKLGIHARDSRWFRVQTEWYNFVDTNVASQASARPKPCCNKIPRM